MCVHSICLCHGGLRIFAQFSWTIAQLSPRQTPCVKERRTTRRQCVCRFSVACQLGTIVSTHNYFIVRQCTLEIAKFVGSKLVTLIARGMFCLYLCSKVNIIGLHAVFTSGLFFEMSTDVHVLSLCFLRNNIAAIETAHSR